MKPYIITKRLDWNGNLHISEPCKERTVVDIQLGRKSEAETYPHKFRLMDAEGVLYFEGYSREYGCMEAFDAMENNYGLTDCQYLEDGKFVTINC